MGSLHGGGEIKGEPPSLRPLARSTRSLVNPSAQSTCSVGQWFDAGDDSGPFL
jgi:hypothetical protein